MSAREEDGTGALPDTLSVFLARVLWPLDRSSVVVVHSPAQGTRIIGPVAKGRRAAIREVFQSVAPDRRVVARVRLHRVSFAGRIDSLRRQRLRNALLDVLS